MASALEESAHCEHDTIDGSGGSDGIDPRLYWATERMASRICTGCDIPWKRVFVGTVSGRGGCYYPSFGGIAFERVHLPAFERGMVEMVQRQKDRVAGRERGLKRKGEWMQELEACVETRKRVRQEAMGAAVESAKAENLVLRPETGGKLEGFVRGDGIRRRFTELLSQKRSQLDEMFPEAPKSWLKHRVARELAIRGHEAAVPFDIDACRTYTRQVGRLDQLRSLVPELVGRSVDDVLGMRVSDVPTQRIRARIRDFICSDAAFDMDPVHEMRRRVVFVSKKKLPRSSAMVDKFLQLSSEPVVQCFETFPDPVLRVLAEFMGTRDGLMACMDMSPRLARHAVCLTPCSVAKKTGRVCACGNPAAVHCTGRLCRACCRDAGCRRHRRRR